MPHKTTSHKTTVLSPFPADMSMDSSVSVTIAVLTSGVVAFSCVLLFATTCLCYHVIIQRKRTLKKEDQVSKQVATEKKKKRKSPEYEEVLLQNHPRFHNNCEKHYLHFK